MTLINKIINAVNGDKELDPMHQSDLNVSFSHFLKDVQNTQQVDDNLYMLKQFHNAIERLPNGRTVKVNHNNGYTYRIIKTNEGLKIAD